MRIIELQDKSDLRKSDFHKSVKDLLKYNQVNELHIDLNFEVQDHERKSIFSEFALIKNHINNEIRQR